MRVVFATDHAGFALKEVLIAFVRDELGCEVDDKGAHVFDSDDDYTDFIPLAAREVSEYPDAIRAIVLGGSGQGEAIAANRFPHVRAAVWYGGGTEVVRLSREHNDANVLSIGARFVTEEEAKEAVRVWLSTPFAGEERHIRRIKALG